MATEVALAAARGSDVVGPLLRIPPFPGARIRVFARLDNGELPTLTDGALDALVELLKRHRIGGTYWAARPALPANHLLVTGNLPPRAELPDGLGDPVFWSPSQRAAASGDRRIICGDCDPWHMLGGATAVICPPDSEIAAIAAILGVPIFTFEDGRYTRLDDSEARELLRRHLAGCMDLADPFTGEALGLDQAVQLCAHWRSLIDRNRDISGALGFAFWKQQSVNALLWGGGEPVPFYRNASDLPRGGAVAVWRSKAAPEALAALEQSGVPLVEVEDGFLRSNGLGADCVPPLSITVDRLGAYFDPTQASELEQLLQTADFDESLLERARLLRETIVAAGLGKYERGAEPIARRAGTRRHILVPGQVEDDRSVLTGGSGLHSNLELLRRVGQHAPGAYIIYKPHPDVLAGHRRGAIARDLSAGIADEIVNEAPISSMISMVDEVHVNTSLAGFEALLRGKKVTAHGVPFYAGWGLTTDLGPVPARRSRRLQLDELVAASLLLYPRYLDPVTGLPCPAEVVVARLCAEQSPDTGVLVAARRFQGKLKRRLQELLS